MEEELDIVAFIKMIRKFEIFYEELGHKWIPARVKARSSYKLIEITSDE